MKNTLLILLFTTFSGFSFAEVTLNKTMAQQYFNAVKSLQAFEDNNFEIADSLESSDFSDKNKFIAQIKKIPQFKTIEKAVKASGFSGIEEFYDIGVKITGGMMALQMDKMPKGVALEQIFSAQEKVIEQMKSSNAPQKHIDEMVKNVQDQKASMNNMIKLGQSASEQDKAFVRNNMQWVMKNMMEHDEDEE